MVLPDFTTTLPIANHIKFNDLLICSFIRLEGLLLLIRGDIIIDYQP